tara:strand:- start:1042 stop:1272 length:231 start_codon:yes stop_codon:yes gene_type:complete
MFTTVQLGKTRNFRADYIQDLLIRKKFMEITEAMLDAIEKVKGKRNPALWDRRCEREMSITTKTVKKKPVKSQTTS